MVNDHVTEVLPLEKRCRIIAGKSHLSLFKARATEVGHMMVQKQIGSIQFCTRFVENFEVSFSCIVFFLLCFSFDNLYLHAFEFLIL